MCFEKKLQSLRKKAGLSQEELASQLGVSRQAVSKWESGSSYPEMDKLILMTKLFKCTLDDLVNDDVKEIETNNKSKKAQNTKDSLLEFITKSISMFTSMKSTSALKCLVEIAVFIFGLVIVTAVLFEVGVGILDSMFSIVYPLTLFFANVYLIVLIALDLIIIFQFYKIRYLDYYDKLVYQQSIKDDIAKKNTSKDDKKNEGEESEQIQEIKSKRISLSHKNEERIIIRDPEHKPLAFLSKISDVIMFIYKCVLRCVTIPFLFLLVFLVIALVILIYLVSYNPVFIGASIVGAAAILLNVLVIRTLSDDLFKENYPIKLMSILFMVSLFVGGLGAGLSIISLKNIDIREADTLTKVSEKFDFNDKLYLNFLSAADGMIVFDKDDTLEDVLVTFEYDSRVFKYELTNPAGDKSYLLLSRIFVSDVSSKQLVDEFLNNLKKNLILTYGYYGGTPVLKVKANEKHIKKLIGNISEKDDIYVNERNVNGTNSYIVYSIDSEPYEIKACYQNDYYKKCFTIIDETDNRDFTYEVKNNEFTYDKTKFICQSNGSNGYYCSDK